MAPGLTRDLLLRLGSLRGFLQLPFNEVEKGKMAPVSLTCTAISPDRYVAFFQEENADREVFAYLPHIPGINPYLLQVGDKLLGWVKNHKGKWELYQAQPPLPNPRACSGPGPNAERVL